MTLWTLNTVNDYISVTSETFGGGSAALAVSRGYKAWTDELTSVQSGVSGSTTNRQNLVYQWDVNGNLTQRQDLNQSSLTETFTLDALNRLKSSTLNNLSVSYDAAGDITNRSDVGSYTYGDSRHPHGVTTAGGFAYAYDANGNVSSRNTLGLTWASYNLPTALQATLGGGSYSSQFQYGPDHQRYQQLATYSNGTEVTYYAGGLFEKVGGSDLQGITWYRNYVPTPSGLTIIVANSSTSTTTTTYVMGDHLGSSDALVDGATGNLLVQESFGAFGQRRGSNWSGVPSGGDYNAIAQATRRGFTFQEELDNIALIHMNGRVYDPNVGRFLSADPYVPDSSNSQSYNRYSYVNNNPLTSVDPSGFDDNGCSPVSDSGAQITDGPPSCDPYTGPPDLSTSLQGVTIYGNPYVPEGLQACLLFGACFEGDYCAIADPAMEACPPSPLAQPEFPVSPSGQTVTVSATRIPCAIGVDCYRPYVPVQPQEDALAACLSNVAANFPEKGSSGKDAGGNAATAVGAGADEAARATAAAIAATNRVGRPLAATQAVFDASVLLGGQPPPSVYIWRGAQTINWAILKGGATVLNGAGIIIDAASAINNFRGGQTFQGSLDAASVPLDVALAASFTASAPVAVPALTFVKTLPANVKANYLYACVRLANGDTGSTE